MLTSAGASPPVRRRPRDLTGRLMEGRGRERGLEGDAAGVEAEEHLSVDLGGGVEIDHGVGAGHGEVAVGALERALVEGGPGPDASTSWLAASWLSLQT